MERLSKVLAQLIEHERTRQEHVAGSEAQMIFNHIGRAYGILANAHSISPRKR